MRPGLALVYLDTNVFILAFEGEFNVARLVPDEAGITTLMKAIRG